MDERETGRRATTEAMMTQAVPYILEAVEDVTEDWVYHLISYHIMTQDLYRAPGDRRTMFRLVSWSRNLRMSEDDTAVLPSTMVDLKVEYEVATVKDGQVEPGPEMFMMESGPERIIMESFVIKLIPKNVFMKSILKAEQRHATEVAQYERFLHSMMIWERQQLGEGNKGQSRPVSVVEEIVSQHVLALCTTDNLTLVLPDLTHLGYEMRSISEGLSPIEALTVIYRLGAFHGTVLAFKTLTNTSLPEAFPGCFQVARLDNPIFVQYTRASLRVIRKLLESHERWEDLLEKFETYESVAASLVVSTLEPQEPYATAVHGDLHPSHIFFRYTSPCPEPTVKMVDWAMARYSQGPLDLVCLLNLGLEAEVRRALTPRALEVYFTAFNAALSRHNAGLTYPREVFERQYTSCRQMAVIWNVMGIHLSASNSRLKNRLTHVLADILLDPTVPEPTLST